MKIKHIDDWVNDLQHVNVSDEGDEITVIEDKLPREPFVLNEPTTTSPKLDVIKLTHGMEAAKMRITAGALPRGLHSLNLSKNGITTVEGLLEITRLRGLHHHLKLTVLDLRFNKFLTTKSLGLLAANYNSLKAISLEGNPAQKNVADEQLRKHLLGLLPHLLCYNIQGTKDARLGKSSHQLDQGLRS
ncbi:unnamed protein product [Cochlearia groenlandica]